MALGTPTELDGAGTNVDTSAIVTASVSPTANADVYVCLWGRLTNSEDGIPTISGLGATWNVVVDETADTNLTQFMVWRANKASFTPGTITITAAGSDVWTSNTYSVVEVTAADSAGLADSVAEVGSTGAAPNAVNVDYTTTTDPASTVIAFGGVRGGGYNASAQANWTELAAHTATGVLALEVHYRIASTETKAEMSWNNGGTNVAYGIAGIEIQEAVAPPGGFTQRSYPRGTNRGIMRGAA